MHIHIMHMLFVYTLLTKAEEQMAEQNAVKFNSRFLEN